MLKLLPHRFKKIGFLIAPTGFFLWIAMQVGWISKFAGFIGFTDATVLNVSFAIFGFLSFLFGIYAIAFSKEKVEDEMIKNVRLESFRTAALVQIFLIIFGLIYIGFMKNPPKDAGMMLFFIIAILTFWVTYIARFNYILHFAILKYEK